MAAENYLKECLENKVEKSFREESKKRWDLGNRKKMKRILGSQFRRSKIAFEY